MIVNGIDVSFARIPNSDRGRFVHGHCTNAYRLIVGGVPGGFSAGFTDAVICKEAWGWRLRRFGTAELASTTVYDTRQQAAHMALTVYRDKLMPERIWEYLLGVAR